MQTIFDILENFDNYNLIEDPQGLMDYCVKKSYFNLSDKGGLNSKAKCGRIIMSFDLTNGGGKVILAIDNSEIKEWKKKGKREHKPLKQLILKLVQ